MPQDTNPFAQWAPDAYRGDARLVPPVGPDEENPFAKWAPSVVAGTMAEPDEEMGEFAKGFAGNVDFAQSAIGTSGIMLGRLFGSEDLEAWGEDLRSRNVEESRQYVPKVARIEDVTSISDFFDYTAFQAGNVLPSIGASIAGVVTGTIAGGAAGGPVGATVGGIGGAFLPSYVLNSGEVYNDLREKGIDKVEAAAIAGIPMALLDIIVPAKVGGRLMWKMTKKVPKRKPRSFLKRLGQETLKLGAIEAPTEAAQQAIGLAFVTRETGGKYLTNEHVSEILNAGIAGLLGGGMVGPVSALPGDPTMPGPAPGEEPPAGVPPAAAPPGGPEIDPATGLPIVPVPTEEPPPTEPPAQPAPAGLPVQAAPSPVLTGPQPPGAPGTPPAPVEPPKAPHPAVKPKAKAPHPVSAPVEPPTEPTPVSGPVAPKPPEKAPQPAETTPAAPTFPDDALKRIETVLKGKHRALATKKQQGDVAKILGLSKDDSKAIDEALDRIGYVPETAPLPGAFVEPSPTEGPALPPDIPTKIFRGYGREDRGKAYSGVAIPMLGQGRYYSFSRKSAEGFGPNVEEKNIDLKNPLIIRDGKEWKALTKEAGWEFPNPFGLPEETQKANRAALQKILRDRGHDGVIIWWDENSKFDIGPAGENIKLLRNVFGKPQVFELSPPWQTPTVGEEPIEAPPTEPLEGGEDLLAIPPFLKRKPREKGPEASVVEPPAAPTPVETKPKKKRRAKKKTSEQVKGLRKLGYPNAAIAKIAEDEATIIIGKQRKYVRLKKKKGPDAITRFENYFRPGRIVPSYGGRDRVISFERLDDDKWQVQVIEVDDKGQDVGDHVRTHATAPHPRDLRKWERQNPPTQEPSPVIDKELEKILPSKKPPILPVGMSIMDEEATRTGPPRHTSEERAEEIERDLGKVMHIPPKEPLGKRVVDVAREYNAKRMEIIDRIISGVVDQFHIFAVKEKKLFGAIRDASVSAWKMMQLTQNLPNVMAVVVGIRQPDGTIIGGPLKWVAGAVKYIPGIKPLAEIFRPVAEMGEDALNGWKAWVIARRAEKLMAEGREQNVTKEFITKYKNIDQEFLVDGRNVFQEAFDEWTRFKNAMLDFAQQSGTIDPKERKIWDDALYVPFYRVIDDITAGPKVKPGIPGQTSGIRRLFGGKDKVDDIIDNIVRNTEKLVDSSFKSVALGRAIPMLLADGSIEEDTSLNWRIAHITPASAAKALAEIGVDMAKLTAEQKDHWLRVFSLAPPKDPKIIMWMDKAKRRYFRVDNPDVLAALTGLGPDQQGGITRLFGWFKRALTYGVTHDPAFMMANALRDTLHAWTIGKQDVKFLTSATRGFRKALATDPDLLNILAGGGGTGGFYKSKSIQAAIEAPAHQRTILSPRGAGQKLKAAWRAYEKFGFASEYANRLGKYEGVKKYGGTEAEAIFQAMDLMNFSMRGSSNIMRFLVTTVPFLNARLQGLYRLGRGAKEPGAMNLLSLQSFAARGSTITAATLALWWVNKDDDRYKDLNQWDRDLYYHFFLDNMLPEEALLAAGIEKIDWHLRFPKPFEVGAIFSTIPERAASLAHGDDRLRDVQDASLRMFLDTFAFNPIPQALKPAIELGMNYSFFREAPIISMSLEKVRPEAQYRPDTSDTARLIGGVLQGLPGGVHSPIRMEYLVRGYFGALGGYILAASDMALRAAPGGRKAEDWRWDQRPIIRRFLRQDPAFSTKWITEFWETRAEIDDIYRTIRRYRTHGEPEKAQAMRQRHLERLQRRKVLDSIANRLRSLDKRMGRVKTSDMSGAEKREAIDQILELKNQTAKRYAGLGL